MMIKTIEQLNREFLDEYISDDKSAKSDVLQEKMPDVVNDGSMREKNKRKTMLRIPDSEPADTKRTGAVRRQPLWKDLILLVLKIAIILLAFAALFTFLFGLVRYDEPAMSPAIKDGDLVLYHRYTKVGYLPQDTIMLERDGQLQARRVVATAGDVVDITEEGLLINGSVQQETDIHQKTERYNEGVSFPLTVPEGHVFLLGDSRTDSTDSRIYGTVEIEDTLGKVMAVIRRRGI